MLASMFVAVSSADCLQVVYKKYWLLADCVQEVLIACRFCMRGTDCLQILYKKYWLLADSIWKVLTACRLLTDYVREVPIACRFCMRRTDLLQMLSIFSFSFLFPFLLSSHSTFRFSWHWACRFYFLDTQLANSVLLTLSLQILFPWHLACRFCSLEI